MYFKCWCVLYETWWLFLFAWCCVPFVFFAKISKTSHFYMTHSTTSPESPQFFMSIFSYFYTYIELSSIIFCGRWFISLEQSGKWHFTSFITKKKIAILKTPKKRKYRYLHKATLHWCAQIQLFAKKYISKIGKNETFHSNYRSDLEKKKSINWLLKLNCYW